MPKLSVASLHSMARSFTKTAVAEVARATRLIEWPISKGFGGPDRHSDALVISGSRSFRE